VKVDLIFNTMEEIKNNTTTVKKTPPAGGEMPTDSVIKNEVSQTSKEGESKKGEIKKKFFSRTARGKREDRQDDEFDQKIIDLARVTRVMKGGKRMRFRAAVAIGDHKGKVGFAIAKGADVSIAISKAVRKAKKDIITVPIINETIPHEIRTKYKAADILLKPSGKGRGVKAGGAMRIILELAGVINVTGKMLGSPNKMNTSRATLLALNSFKKKKRG